MALRAPTPSPPVGGAYPSRASSAMLWLDRILGPLALVTLLTVAAWLAIPMIMRGLSSADDAYFAEFAKTFAMGRGYGLPGSSTSVSLFEPNSGSGPALMLPLAAVIRLLGTSDQLPALVAFLGFLVQLFIVGLVLGRRFGWIPAVGFLATLLLALVIFVRDYYIIATFLGEAWTLGYLLIGAAFLAVADRRWEIACGAVALSLAVLTKQVGLFGAGAIALSWLALLAIRGVGVRELLRRTAILAVSGAALLVLYETVKLISLGPDGYVELKRQELIEARLPGGHASTDALRTIISTLDGVYKGAVTFAAMALASIALMIVARRTAGGPSPSSAISRGTALWLMLWAGAAGQLVHFVVSRSDWPRYLWLTVALGCAASAAPVIALPPRVRGPLMGVVLAAAAVVLMVRPLPADPFRENVAHAERMAVVAWLDAHPDLPYIGSGWAQLHDVLFSRRDEGRWTIGSIHELPPEPFVYVLNHVYLQDSTRVSPLYVTAMRNCPPVLEQDTVSLYRCEEPFWEDLRQGVAAVGPTGGVLDPLETAEHYTPAPGMLLSTTDEAPPGSTGTSLVQTLTDVAPGRNQVAVRNLSADLSALVAEARLSVWVKVSTIENLGSVYLMVNSPGGWAAFGLQPTAADEWYQVVMPLASPSSSDGIDWSAVTSIELRVDAAAEGPYTGQIAWHDLRVSR